MTYKLGASQFNGTDGIFILAAAISQILTQQDLRSFIEDHTIPDDALKILNLAVAILYSTS